MPNAMHKEYVRTIELTEAHNLHKWAIVMLQHDFTKLKSIHRKSSGSITTWTGWDYRKNKDMEQQAIIPDPRHGHSSIEKLESGALSEWITTEISIKLQTTPGSRGKNIKNHLSESHALGLYHQRRGRNPPQAYALRLDCHHKQHRQNGDTLNNVDKKRHSLPRMRPDTAEINAFSIHSTEAIQ